MESRTVAVTDDDVEVLDTDDAEGTGAFATYFPGGNKACDTEVMCGLFRSCFRGVPLSRLLSS